MVFGFVDVSMTPKTNLFNFADTETLQRMQGTMNQFWKILLWEIAQVQKSKFVSKDGNRKSERTTEYILRDLEYGINISISPEKH